MAGSEDQDGRFDRAGGTWPRIATGRKPPLTNVGTCMVKRGGLDDLGPVWLHCHGLPVT